MYLLIFKKAALFFMAAFFMFNSSTLFANDILFDSLQWKARTLVLTGERDDPLVIGQIGEFKANVDGIRERGIAVIRFDGDAIFEMSDLSRFDYRGRYDMNANLQRYYESEMQSDNDKFSIVLFGKDGMLKKVWKENEDIVPLSEVFAIIDEMPMRQREMNKK